MKRKLERTRGHSCEKLDQKQEKIFLLDNPVLFLPPSPVSSIFAAGDQMVVPPSPSTEEDDFTEMEPVGRKKRKNLTIENKETTSASTRKSQYLAVEDKKKIGEAVAISFSIDDPVCFSISTDLARPSKAAVATYRLIIEAIENYFSCLNAPKARREVIDNFIVLSQVVFGMDRQGESILSKLEMGVLLKIRQQQAVILASKIIFNITKNPIIREFVGDLISEQSKKTAKRKAKKMSLETRSNSILEEQPMLVSSYPAPARENTMSVSFFSAMPAEQKLDSFWGNMDLSLALPDLVEQQFPAIVTDTEDYDSVATLATSGYVPDLPIDSILDPSLPLSSIPEAAEMIQNSPLPEPLSPGSPVSPLTVSDKRYSLFDRNVLAEDDQTPDLSLVEGCII